MAVWVCQNRVGRRELQLPVPQSPGRVWVAAEKLGPWKTHGLHCAPAVLFFAGIESRGGQCSLCCLSRASAYAPPALKFVLFPSTVPSAPAGTAPPRAGIVSTRGGPESS